MDNDNPELTDADLERAVPFSQAFPQHHEAWKQRGRPPVDKPKGHINFRLAADVAEGIRATGRRYDARVEKVPRAALVRGELRDRTE
jgi:uncharacterized protein (DUF4415 family)